MESIESGHSGRFWSGIDDGARAAEPGAAAASSAMDMREERRRRDQQAV